jgi:hypothetical protein
LNTLSKTKKVIYSLLLLTIFWSSVWIVSVVNSASDNSLVNHLPSGVSSVIKVNNRQIFKRFLFDALYASELSTNEFDQLKYNKEDVEIPTTGISLSQNIFVFQDKWEDVSITGFIFNLSDKNAFADFQLKRPNAIKTFNDKVGCIILLPKKVEQDAINYFELYAADLLLPNKDKLKAKIALSNSKEESLFHLFFAGSNQAYVQDLSLQAFISKSTINFEGIGLKNPIISYDSVEHYSMVSSEKEQFLEIQAGQLPDSVYSYIDVVLEDFDLKLPHIVSQQLFIYGFMIDNLDGSTAFLPKFDGIFRFDKNIDLVDEIDSLSTNNKKVERLTPNKIRIGEIDYYFKQLTDKEIWIGITENIVIDKVDGAPLPRLRGNPAATLMIEGKGIIAQFAQMLPPVQYSKKLFNDLEYFDIHTELTTEDKIRVTGEMRFKDNKSASIELLMFMM